MLSSQQKDKAPSVKTIEEALFLSTFTNGFQCRLNASYYLLRGGFLSYSSLSDAGSRGYYWSSTPNGFSYAYGLYFGSGYVDTYLNYRYLDYSVRCVAAG